MSTNTQARGLVSAIVMDRLTKDALLAAYQNGQRCFAAIDLTGAELFEVDLRQIDLQGSCLDESYIPYGNLSGAKLGGASLIKAHLGDVNLYGADLQAALLTGADLGRADLRGANLHEANLDGANLSGADLRGANLSATNLEGANLSAAKLEGANLKGANLSRCNLFRATGADLVESRCDSTTILPNGYNYGR